MTQITKDHITERVQRNMPDPMDLVEHHWFQLCITVSMLFLYLMVELVETQRNKQE